MDKRNLDDIDLAKGLGIILVIMGHSLFPLHVALDIFHMPLFFFIAGLIFSFKGKEVISDVILGKVDRIFIPLCFFTALSGFLELFLTKVGNGPFNGPLWFLQVFFQCLIIYYLIDFFVSKAAIKHVIVVFLSLFAFVLARFDIKLFLNLDLSFMALSFLHLGYLLKDKYRSMKISQTLIVLVLSVLLYLIGLFYSIELGLKEGSSFLSRIYKYSFVLFYVTSLSGIFVILTVSKLIKKVYLVNYLGKNSLIILCVHFPLIERLNDRVATLDLYHESIQGKLILACMVNSITIVFSILCIEFFSKYLPRLTGYKSAFKV